MGDLVVASLPKTLTSIDIPANLELAEWLELASSASELREACTWYLVDALQYGYLRYGESFWQVGVSVRGLTEYSINRYLSLAKSFPPASRVEGLSVSHHEAVRSLDTADQERLLQEALLGGLNREELRELSRRARQSKKTKTGLEPAGFASEKNLSPERSAWRGLLRSSERSGVHVSIPMKSLDALGKALFGETYRWENELGNEKEILPAVQEGTRLR